MLDTLENICFHHYVFISVISCGRCYRFLVLTKPLNLKLDPRHIFTKLVLTRTKISNERIYLRILHLRFTIKKPMENEKHLKFYLFTKVILK